MIFIQFMTVVGAYLLYITWADRQVLGSPFKVTVLPASTTDSGTLLAAAGATTGAVAGGSAATLGRDMGSSLDHVDTSRVMRTTETTKSRSAQQSGRPVVVSK